MTDIVPVAHFHHVLVDELPVEVTSHVIPDGDDDGGDSSNDNNDATLRTRSDSWISLLVFPSSTSSFCWYSLDSNSFFNAMIVLLMIIINNDDDIDDDDDTFTPC